MDGIRVVTYNILSSYLFAPDKYIGDDYREDWNIDDLDNITRLEVIMSKIKNEIEIGHDEHYGFSKTIICLQEVDIFSADIIEPFMLNLKYRFIYRHYGAKYSGYMGVAILLPMQMNIFHIDSFCLSEGKRWRSQQDTKYEKIVRKLSFGYIYSEKRYFGWENARYRKNIQLTVEVQMGESSFLISTVHLPCKFQYESVMLTYCALAMRHIFELSSDGSIPYILAGDFNIQPDSLCYRLITSGNIENEEIFQEEYPPSDVWRPEVVTFFNMVSAINANKGKEPEWTTKCHTNIFDYEPFQGCLDYIFVSRHWLITDSFGDHDDLERNLPNEEETSDHLLIWSEIMLDHNISMI